jgi:hypothetical protein
VAGRIRSIEKNPMTSSVLLYLTLLRMALLISYIRSSILVSLSYFITLKSTVFWDVTPCSPIEVL